MEAKEKKKQEEIEAKEARKQQREEKKRKKEEEAKKKAEERGRKAAERQQRKLEQEEARKRRAEEKKQKEGLRWNRPQQSTGSRRSLTVSSVGESTSGADGEPHTDDTPSRTTVGDNTVPGDSGGQEEEDQSECSVCLGRYEDDIIDGVLQKEWVRCTNTSRCGLWMHSDCLSTEGNSYVCYMCNKTFK